MAGVSWTWARGMDMDMVLLILAGSIDMNGTCHLLPTPSTNLARKQSSEQISPNTRHTLLTHARAMHFSKSAVLLAVLRVAAEGTTAYPPMGPAAFMWPTDRPWSADTDNIAPCGSSSGVGPRTEFPMSECTSTDLAQRKHDQSDEHDTMRNLLYHEMRPFMLTDPSKWQTCNHCTEPHSCHACGCFILEQ